ncbi:succinate-semialdehyde dehydrogenase (NADP+) [Cladophialophora psammophila CBS 110553]|uniref:Succinate-semialdehyde dehydrogenase (NADP+) n=1 Tax=Cladophialophora psammophila CBS 110553 TaxID=1182543 RepID=W9WFX2_9EURO|nr:succinate-semialdehyde dehydrogenase (NADP+) [Cladophialophora psammophila CBS 110553]EXJ63486.1 succinate-semialdehyde dehydrogenase (NADP+) [Cladophialophora psammophila CBS 110553]
MPLGSQTFNTEVEERTHGETIPSAYLAQRIVTDFGENRQRSRRPRQVSTCFNVITTLHLVAEVGEALCTNKLVRKLSFTGSTRIGKLLTRQCSENLTKPSLELGGNRPFIVFDDTDVDKAKVRNGGQTCVTANRILVQAGIHDKFVSVLIEKVNALKVGPGTEEGVDIGALTHERAV